MAIGTPDEMSEFVSTRAAGSARHASPERVVDGIREHMRARNLAPGDSLPSEQALGAMFGVSRAMVRTALGVLAALRMIEITNGRRARVIAIDRGLLSVLFEHAVQTDRIDIEDFFDGRRTIELRAAALAARHRTPAQATRLVDLCVAMGVALTAPARFVEHDLAFHEAVAAASGNLTLLLLLGSFQSVLRGVLPIVWATRRGDVEKRELVAAHAAIAEAIARQDAPAAEAAMAAHLDMDLLALRMAGAI